MSRAVLSLTVEPAAARQRLDRFLTALGTWGTRSQVQRLIAQGLVRLDGQPAKSGAVLRCGQRVDIQPAPAPSPNGVEPAPIPLDVLYEDAWLLVINKPAGLVVHPAPGNWQGTVVSALLHRWQGRPSDLDPLRPGIVHRLDKDTSGVLLIAKDAATLADLARQFRGREVGKEYLALVWGRVREPRGEITGPIGRHPVHRKRMSVRASGRAAVTRYDVIAQNAAASLLRVWPRTGRTHQIRVHLATLGHPIVGDVVYGGRRARTTETGVRRQALHAASLTFQHPQTGKSVCVTAPLPADMRQACDDVGLSGLTSRGPSSSVFARNAPRPSDSAPRVLLGQTRSPRYPSPS
ncbi:MAG TPA: RluA family pseudouridine synthase [Candidatus Kryptonia bacterium]|nr:RluA family pseudouridine synthase [Candidatus Kryptonia bacterium]